MLPAHRYLHRDLLELGFVNQHLLERAHSYWFWGTSAGDDCAVPDVLSDLVHGTRSKLLHLVETGLGDAVRGSAHGAESALSIAWDAYRERWMARQHREMLRDMEMADYDLSPEAERSHSPLSTQEWMDYRQGVADLGEALSKQCSRWIELGGLIAQVLTLANQEQRELLGERYPIPALQDLLRRMRETDPAFGDLQVELSDVETNQYGSPDLESVKQKVRVIRETLVDHLTHQSRTAADVAWIVGEDDRASEPSRGVNCLSVGKPPSPDRRDDEESDLPYSLIPPTQFSWKGAPPIDLPPQQWRLLSYSLGNRRALVQDVADHLWGDESSSDKSESAIDSLKSKLNSRLAEGQIPITLARKAGFLILSIDG